MPNCSLDSIIYIITWGYHARANMYRLVYMHVLPSHQVQLEFMHAEVKIPTVITFCQLCTIFQTIWTTLFQCTPQCMHMTVYSCLDLIRTPHVPHHTHRPRNS